MKKGSSQMDDFSEQYGMTENSSSGSGSRVKELVYTNLTCTQRTRAKHVKIAQLKYRTFV